MKDFEEQLNDLIDRYIVNVPHAEAMEEVISVLELKLMALKEEQRGEQP